MAAAWLTHRSGDAFDAAYAGIDATQVMDGDILEVMREVGMELSETPPQAMATLRSGEFDLMIVLRSRDEAPELALEHVSRVLSWPFGPLSDAEAVGRRERLAFARRMRDELRTRVSFLVNTRSLDV